MEKSQRHHKFLSHFYKNKYMYSNEMYGIKFDVKKHYANDFLKVLNDIIPIDIYPIGDSIDIKMKEYKSFDEFMTENEINSSDDTYVNMILKIKKMMMNKLQEFLGNYNKPTGDYELNKQIFFNYGHYEIRDYIEETYNAEMVSNAWIKLHDLIQRTLRIKDIKKLDVFRSFHICELPGSFISATNHYVKTNSDAKYEWIAQSLIDPSNKNMIQDQYGMYKYYTKKYDLGNSGDGDMYNKDNIAYYIDKYSDVKFNLITSDCGEEADLSAEMKEDKMWKIHWHQLIMAIGLKTDAYIGKIYSIYTNNLAKILMIAKIFFDKVILRRPFTTKIASDEIYIICRHQKDYDRSVWKKLLELNLNSINISKDISRRIYKLNLLLTYRRITSINLLMFILNNIHFIKDSNDLTQDIFGQRRIYDITQSTRNYYIKNYVKNVLLLKPIKDSQKLLPVDSKEFGKKKSRYTHNYDV